MDATTKTRPRPRPARWTSRLSVAIPDDTRIRLDQAAQRLDRDLSWVVRQALTEWLERHHPAQ